MKVTKIVAQSWKHLSNGLHKNYGNLAARDISHDAEITYNTLIIEGFWAESWYQST